MDIHNTKQRYKRTWKEKAERKVKKRLKLEEQQDYILKKVHRLLEPKCSLNCNSSSNSSNNNLSVSIESIEENLSNDLIGINFHSQSEVEIQNNITLDQLSHDMSSNENENRNENVNIYDNESTDESENMDENEYINESEETDESEDKNVNMIFQNDEQKESYILSALRKWALSGGVISMSKIDELLAKLRPVFNNLPKSYKTLLKTDDIHITQFENGGQFWYRGIKNYLDELILEKYLEFVVVKFISENEDCDEEDDTLFEVGLTKWLVEKLYDDTNTKISWPPRSEQGIALKRKLDAHSLWPTYNVVVLKFYDTLLDARQALNRYIISSNNETDHEFGRGKRKKIKRQLSCDESFSTNVRKNKKYKNISTSDDSDFDEKDGARQEFKCKQSAPSPPPISLPQSNKAEKNNKDSKTKIKILQNVKLKKNLMLTSQNTKSRKDILLTKIHQAKKENIVSNAAKENIDPNILRQNFLKIQDKEKMSAENNDSKNTSVKSINLETPSTSQDITNIYQHDILDKKLQSPMRNVSCLSELRDMSPVSFHVTACTSTPRSSYRSDNVLSDVPEVEFDVKAFEKKIYTIIQEISSKLDVTIMNQCRLNRYLLPHEKQIVRPADLPALPLTAEEELKKFEKFLLKDDNVGATICYISQVIGPKDNAKEAMYKILKKLISNTLASEFTLKGKSVQKMFRKTDAIRSCSRCHCE